uniref:Uncharacterized protein n=1 Tax=Pyxicephalus adspersus TaxID=30357 RepID=A0AAV3AMG3_PYXAD|nr:TPA: hypothetical protein GDO54_010006 [Pyxicephalus adspersus]
MVVIRPVNMSAFVHLLDKAGDGNSSCTWTVFLPDQLTGSNKNTISIKANRCFVLVFLRMKKTKECSHHLRAGKLHYITFLCSWV